jgi:hypothetical protein
VRGNDDLALTLLGDLDNVAEGTGAALNLDLVVQELLERGNVEDLVGSRLGGIDHELGSVSAILIRNDSGGMKRQAYLESDLLLLSALGSLLYSIFSAICCLLIVRLRKRISSPSQPTSKAFGGRTTGAIAEVGVVFARECVGGWMQSSG